ncbi:low molecular weight phosphatase family protein [Streptomyces sp. FIT100]|uniref:arsenate reductase/protein-tyrosine-phosphatase family protein n=1 Tax=Streptomyces sp. FIT100 TaxID=2837956 RepID=UPI0021CA359A|nr:low molecular weight phosphatase family protein [Streptomyces sp. FIT100]
MRDSDRPTDAVSPSRFRVLTVCTGNLYRSPLAERLLREGLAAQRATIHVSSAGTAAVPGAPAPETATAVPGWAHDPSGAVTVARRLTTALVDGADLLLGAATEHREAAVRLSPVRALSRAFCLREFARLVRAEDAAGVVDPAGRLRALVRGAAARRGAPGPDGADDDVPDPLGASPAEVHVSVERIEESVERIVAAMASG